MTEAETVLAWSLEAALDAAWPGLKSVRAGDWLCKSAPGVSRRANSANPAGAHTRLTQRAIEAIEAVYAKWAQPAYVRLPSLLDGEADEALERRGYSAEGLTLTLVAPVQPRPEGLAELSMLPSPEWLAAVNRMNGREGERAAVFDEAVALIDVPATFAAVRREGKIVAGAYAAAVDGWLCLEAVVTDPGWRGQGLAGDVVSALIGWGAARGARAAGLQVEASNAAGRRLYGKLGFEHELYRYHYRKAA